MKRLKKIASVMSLAMVVSFPTYAVTCPPFVPCPQKGQAKDINGSNAEQELMTFTQSISEETSLHAQTLVDAANATASSINQGANSIIAAMFEASQIEADQDMRLMRAMGEMEMAMEMHIANQDASRARAVVGPDDTKEEFEVITTALEDYEDLSVPEIILVLREEFDNDEEAGKVNVPIPSSQGICDENAIKVEGKCVIPKRVYPSKKLQSLFKLCSIEKRAIIESIKAKNAYENALALANKATMKALESTGASDAISARMRQSKELSCSPAEFKAGYCGSTAGGTPEDYQEAIVAGKIIPNGDVSAANFTSPTTNSAEGYLPTSVTKQEIVAEEMENTSLDRRKLQQDPNQRAVPIEHTYRNANQVLSALMFIDNIVSDDIVPALPANDRKKVNTAEYQARFLQRTAALNMSRMVLNQYMMDRVGTKMEDMISSGAFDSRNPFDISIDSPAYKEDVLGASPIDILKDRVNKLSANLQTPEDNPDSINNGNDFIAAPNEADTMNKVLESMYIETELMMKDYLMQEQINAMRSVQLAQEINSPQVVNLLKELRGGRK